MLRRSSRFRIHGKDHKIAELGEAGFDRDRHSVARSIGLDCFETFVVALDEKMEIITNYFIRRSNSGWIEGLNNSQRAEIAGL